MKNSRKFLERVLESGLTEEALSADDILRHLSPDVIANHIPRPFIANLIEASLGAKVMDAALVVNTLGIHTLSKSAPSPVLWRIIDEAASVALSNAPVKVPRSKSALSKASKPTDDAKADRAKPSDSAKVGDGAKSAATATVGDSAKSAATAKVGDSAKSATIGQGAATSDAKNDASPTDSAAVAAAVEPTPTAKHGAPAVEDVIVELESESTNVDPKDSSATVDAGVSSRVRTAGATSRRLSGDEGVSTTRTPYQRTRRESRSPRKPNRSSRPDTEAGRLARNESDPPPPSRPKRSGDVEEDTAVNVLPDVDVGSGPPPRAPTLDPEVETALAGLEMEEFEIDEEEILDESVQFEDARAGRKR